jgi:hypothetical protein
MNDREVKNAIFNNKVHVFARRSLNSDFINLSIKLQSVHCLARSPLDEQTEEGNAFMNEHSCLWNAT